MILKVLFIQRICSYDGEHAPEALCCVDEYCNDENPDWFKRTVEKELAINIKNISSHAIIDIEVDHNKIDFILNNNPKIQSKII